MRRPAEVLLTKVRGYRGAFRGELGTGIDRKRVIFLDLYLQRGKTANTSPSILEFQKGQRMIP